MPKVARYHRLLGNLCFVTVMSIAIRVVFKSLSSFIFLDFYFSHFVLLVAVLLFQIL